MHDGPHGTSLRMRVAFAMETIITSMTRDDLARLLARAHYALADTGPANQALADELNQAATRIETNPAPGRPMSMWASSITARAAIFMRPSPAKP